jgi:hypothetical protein
MGDGKHVAFGGDGWRRKGLEGRWGDVQLGKIWGMDSRRYLTCCRL